MNQFDNSCQFPKGINSALIADLEKRLRTHSLLNWIEERALSLSRFGCRGTWIDLSGQLLNEVGVEGNAYSNSVLGTSQLRVEESGRILIEHHNFRSHEDRRFWIAHEIGHMMWRDPKAKQQALSPLERQLGADPTIEWLCNRFAAALLLPRGLLARTFVRHGGALSDGVFCCDIKWIPIMAHSLRVPERLLVRRIFHDLMGSDLFILRVSLAGGRANPATFAVVRWEAIPRCSLTKPKSLVNRRIPVNALPSGEVTDGGLDERLLSLYESAFSTGRARPLEPHRNSNKEAFGSARWIAGEESGRDCILTILTNGKEPDDKTELATAKCVVADL